jgi:hypothetical protein
MDTQQQTQTESREETAQQEQGPDEALFDDDERSGFRSRWDEIQSGFVDEPREAVEKADALVADVVDRLTTGFSAARSSLEEQWAKGEDASTEDLRVVLTRYRSFFKRLLAT